MKQVFLSFGLLLLCSVLSGASAQVSNVGLDLQEIYEHFTGTSLEDAIEEFRLQKCGPASGLGNVEVRLNGGGPDNYVILDTVNTLEFVITNDAELSGMSLGFEFDWDASFTVNWDDSYGNHPPVNEENDAVGAMTMFNVNGLLDDVSPDTVLWGGAAYPGGGLPADADGRLCYTMQFTATGSNQAPNGFCIDNIMVGPAGTWNFTDNSGAFPPDFQGCANSATNDPDAPQVCFDVDIPPCFAVSKSPRATGPRRRPPDRIVADCEKHPAVWRERDGSVSLRVVLTFDGNVEDLKALGIEPGLLFEFTGNKIDARFPLGLLPEICKVKGGRRSRAGGTFELKLNYSTPDVEGEIFLMGTFEGEALILAETGNISGALQIAGTDSTIQLSFFIIACDYTLIGEEMYSASAYLTDDARIKASLRAQDLIRLLLLILLLLTPILALLGIDFYREAF